jgi:hypothetical protein
MSSLVTTSTIAAADLSDALALVAVLAFLVIVIQKELASSTSDRRLLTLSRGLDIAIVPLGVAFVMIAAAWVVRILG